MAVGLRCPWCRATFIAHNRERARVELDAHLAELHDESDAEDIRRPVGERAVRVDIRVDEDAGGWFLDYVGDADLPFTTFFRGPFATRSEAARAIPEYQKALRRSLPSS